MMIYVSKKPNKSFTMDLLLLHDENAHHYVLILNLERFVAYFTGIVHRAAQRICRICFHCVQTEKFIKTMLKHAVNMQQQKLLCQKKATLPYSSETGMHAGFFLSFYTLTQNLILFQSLQHKPHPLLPTQFQLKNMNLVVMQ